MGKLNFSINLQASSDKLMQLFMDYENLSDYLPQQLQSVKILNQENGVVTTEEIITFKTIFKNRIQQQTIHKKISNEKLQTEIISGPAKGTIVDIEFKKNNSSTIVIIEIDLKLNLKTKFLQPLIKKLYKKLLTGILYKMNSKAIDNSI